MAFDKLYWLRIGFAALGALMAEELVGTDYASGVSIGIGMYLISYYLARFTWYKGADKAIQAKVYSTGWGGYIMGFLFLWTLLFTLKSVGFFV
jgi:hypothetical protein